MNRDYLTRHASVAVGLALAFTGFVSAASSGSAGPSEPDDLTTASPDVVALSESYKIPIEEALADAIAERKWSDFIDEVISGDPNAYVTATWDRNRGEVVVHPGAGARVAALAQQSGIDVTVRTSLAMSESERGAVEAKVASALSGIGIEGAFVHVDPEVSTLTVSLAHSASEARVAEVRLVANAVVDRESAQELSVEVQQGDFTVTYESSTQGGEAYFDCTSGFLGYRGSAYGIITAKHCTTKPSTYDGDSTGTTYTATNYDIRFTVLSGGTPQNLIKIGGTSTRTITSWGYVTAGMNACKYGVSKGYGCRPIDASMGCITSNPGGGQSCGLWRTELQSTALTANGDSGGPWFFSNKAYGTHTGSYNTGSGGACPCSSLLTPISYLGNVSGAPTLKTS